MPGNISFDDLDLREEPTRVTPIPNWTTSRCGNTDACTDVSCNCTTTRFC